jgi:hypothetical protein
MADLLLEFNDVSMENLGHLVGDCGGGVLRL